MTIVGVVSSVSRELNEVAKPYVYVPYASESAERCRSSCGPPLNPSSLRRWCVSKSPAWIQNNSF